MFCGLPNRVRSDFTKYGTGYNMFFGTFIGSHENYLNKIWHYP